MDVSEIVEPRIESVVGAGRRDLVAATVVAEAHLEFQRVASRAHVEAVNVPVAVTDVGDPRLRGVATLDGAVEMALVPCAGGRPAGVSRCDDVGNKAGDESAE